MFPAVAKTFSFRCLQFTIFSAARSLVNDMPKMARNIFGTFKCKLMCHSFAVTPIHHAANSLTSTAKGHSVSD